MGRSDRDLVAERTEDTMTRSNREEHAERSDEAARRRPREQQSTAGGPTRSIPVRAERYLVAPALRQLLPQVPEPARAQQMIDRLTDDPEIHIVRIIQPATRTGQSMPVVVVEMAPDHAARLAASPEFHIETDQPLRYGTAALPYTD